MYVIHIVLDNRRFDDDMAVVLKRRHNALGVERQISGIELIAGPQVDGAIFQRGLFLEKREPHLDRANRRGAFVKFKHCEFFPSNV